MERKIKVFGLAAVLMLAALVIGCKQNISTSKVAVTGVTLNESELTLEEGKTVTLTATVNPENATNKKVTWSSDKADIAAVDKDGTVTAHKAGEAVITVKSEDGGKTASCKVTVTLIEYTITYHLDGGSNHADNPAKYTVETETITLQPANKADHIFFGWYGNADFSGEKVTQIGKGNSGNKELHAKFIEMKMIDIDAVTNGNLGHNDESNNTVHTVSLTAYRIGETEVTQELWQAVMNNNPSWFNGDPGKEAADGEEQKKCPVECVSWYHAIAFCNKLSIACGLEPCYTVKDINFDTLTFHDLPTSHNSDWDSALCDWSKNGFRLPTEAEWEWAAMGGTSDKWAGTNNKSELKDYAWYKHDGEGNANGKTHEVKKKKANGYGLYDMSGNVWEWCWDRYDSLPNSMEKDYAGAVSGFRRVGRGGNWNGDADSAARAYRSNCTPDGSLSYAPCYSYSGLGFRLACRP